MNKVKSLFYFFWLEAKRKAISKKYFAEVDITDNCNLRCKHCYHFNGKSGFNVKELPVDVWKQRFLELHKTGIRYILLVGGEPTLRKDILNLADKMFPYVYVITNGIFKINDEFDHVLFVSLEGTQETNDSIRGQGVFSKVMHNYKGDKRVIINITLTKENYKELEDVIKLSKENGFRGVVCNIYTPIIGKESPMSITKEDRNNIIAELKRVKSLYPNDFILTKSMIKWYEHPDHRKSCYWGDETLHFDVSWNKRRCFANADCSNCGCFAGAVQNPLKMIKNPKELTKLFN
jgi:Fe-coproporphyrin III synthase